MTLLRAACKATAREALLPFLVAVWMLGLFLWVHVWFMTPPVLLHRTDEGYIAAFAVRLLDHRMLPFVDAVSHRGPLLYWTVALFAKLLGPMTWWPVRVCSLCAAVATVSFTFAAARRRGHELAGAFAVLLLAAVHLVTVTLLAGVSLNGEPLVNAFVMPGFFCLVVGLGRHRDTPRLGWVFASGVLLALGALTKQLSTALVVPWGLWVVAAAVARSHVPVQRRKALVAAYLCGFALPISLTVLRYAVAGELHTLWYWMVTYNRTIYVSPFPPWLRPAVLRDWAASYLVLISIGLPAGIAFLLWPLRHARSKRDVLVRYDRSGFGATVTVTALVAAGVSNLSMRDYTHYYLPLVPWAGLFAGLVIERLSGLAGRSPRTRSILLQGALLLPVAALVTVTTAGRLKGYRIARGTQVGWPNAQISIFCSFFDRLAARGTPMFTWGFAPDLYVGCQRPPASRFLFTTFVSGAVPSFMFATPAEDDARTVPGSRQQMLDDLRKDKPTIILDAPITLGDRSMTCYPEFYGHLAAHYCDAGLIATARAYVLRKATRDCPPNSVPVVSPAACVGRGLAPPPPPPPPLAAPRAVPTPLPAAPPAAPTSPPTGR